MKYVRATAQWAVHTIPKAYTKKPPDHTRQKHWITTTTATARVQTGKWIRANYANNRQKWNKEMQKRRGWLNSFIFIAPCQWYAILFNIHLFVLQYFIVFAETLLTEKKIEWNRWLIQRVLLKNTKTPFRSQIQIQIQAASRFVPIEFVFVCFLYCSFFDLFVC